MTETILVVEDELALRETISYNLHQQGYQVLTAEDGETAIQLAKENQPDLMLLDIMLPNVDGFEVCRILRKEMNLPILMLTARSSEIDRVLGLEMGADDYIVKPFSMRELLSRVKAQLRRVRMIRDEISHKDEGAIAEESRILQYGNLKIDNMRREVSCNQQILILKPKEYELLHYLADHCRVALSRDKILREVWGWEYTGGTRTVDVHIRWLREKIEDDPANPSRIITVHGVGYRFEG
ncbi:MAG: response regulator transcription factor [Anaerolineae bacterium]|jgi:DNA-binding response OmpR family regulator|nr:response regulator transcription factor [Anaerolineae bacterium]